MRKSKNSLINVHTVFILLIVVFFLFFDKSVAYWMNEHMNDTWFFRFSSFLSVIFVTDNMRWVAVFSALISCLYVMRSYSDSAKPFAFIAVNFFLCYVIAFILKFTLARYRPEMLFTENVYGFSFFSLKYAYASFPSGHTIAVFSFALAFFCIFREKSICYGVLIIAIIVALSRVIVSAHYCSDVIASIYLSIIITKYVDSIYLRR